MRHLFRLAAITAALYMVASVSNAAAPVSDTPKLRVQTEAVQTGLQSRVDSATGLMTGGNAQPSSSLSAGLQALLAYNAARGEFYAVSADTTKSKEEKKEQVRKGDREFEAQPKGAKKESSAEKDEDDDGNFGSSCMAAIGESLCDALFGGEAETVSVVAEGAGSTVVTTGPGAQVM